jgi:hypothetical protein
MPSAKKTNMPMPKILSILTKKKLDHVKSNDLGQKQINIDQASRMSVLSVLFDPVSTMPYLTGAEKLKKKGK